MLDKLSKKLLKHLCAADKDPCGIDYDFQDGLDEVAKAVSADPEAVRAAVRYLENLGYLEYVEAQTGFVLGFRLNHKGLHWKEFRRMERHRYLLDKWIDILALVSSAVALFLSLFKRCA